MKWPNGLIFPYSVELADVKTLKQPMQLINAEAQPKGETLRAP